MFAHESFVLAWFLRISKHNVWVSQSILLQLLPMRTQNPNLSCASAFVRESRTFHSINALCTFYRMHTFLCPQRNFGRHIVIALSVRPSVRPSVSPSVRPSVRPSRFRVRSISPIFFELGIPNLVCGYILGWRSVAYHFRVTVTLTLTSDLDFIIIMSGAYLLYYLS